ncbi:MAG: glycosyltransferase family 4 protein [Vicinamibacterales bacterium]
MTTLTASISSERSIAPRLAGLPSAAPMVAAVTMSPEGGGIAAVSRTIWQALHEAWPAAELVTLFPTSAGVHTTRPHFSTQVRFGMTLLKRQLAREDNWLFFTHLALGQAQAFVPPGLRRPYALFLHGIEAWAPLGPAARRVVQEAALLIANSHHTATRVRASTPSVGEIAVCPLALPHDATLEAVDWSAPRKRMVLMVGRMLAAERYKGHDQMLEAWVAVNQVMPDARLVIVGGGDDVARLQQKGRELGISDAVTFTGFISAHARSTFYRDAALFAMPSRGEGFGLVYLEAMAQGLPCIASRQDAGQEVVRDGVTGLLVDQDDVPGLSARLVELLAHPERRHAMGRAGRDLVEAEYTYDRFASRLLSLVAGARDRLSPGARR